MTDIPRLQSNWQGQRIPRAVGVDDAVYNSRRWRGLRAKFLRQFPYCPCGMIASEVHHVATIRSKPELAYEWSNLAARCAECHRREHKPQ